VAACVQHRPCRSIAQRLGVVCLAGAVLGLDRTAAGPLARPNPVKAASAESLLGYMLHLQIIFGSCLRNPSGSGPWEWHSLAGPEPWPSPPAVIAATLAACVQWQKIRPQPVRARKLQRGGLTSLGVYFLGGGWSPTITSTPQPRALATEPYSFPQRCPDPQGLAPTRTPEPGFPRKAVNEKLRLKGGRVPANIKR